MGLPPVIAAFLFLALAVIFQPRQVQAASKYASIVIDNHTGRVLYSRNADQYRYPASLTKIMTLYMLFDHLNAGKATLKTHFKFSKHAANQAPSKLGLKPGQTISVENAIRALVTKSANDVAVVVAENIAGSEAKFAQRMTKTARKIGMSKTTFRNASGLPNKQQRTTARDMATLSRRIMQDFPKYYPYFRLKYFTYKKKRYRNHNGLLFTYKGTDGVKTGYTRASGFNLAASVRRKNKHLVAVVMGGKSSKSRNQTMEAILNKSMPRAVARVNSPRAVTRVNAPRATTPSAPVRNPIQRKPVVVARLAAPLPVPPGTVMSNQVPANVLNAPAGKTAPVTRQNAYHVQVGAYSSQTEAIKRLNAIQSKAGKVLQGHQPITMPLPNPKRYLFRARFAGFSEAKARATCSQLISRAIPCVIMRAQ